MMLSCVINGDVLILGTPDCSIAEFKNEAKIREFVDSMLGLSAVGDEIGCSATATGKLLDAFQSILGGDPRLHDNDVDFILDNRILSTPAVAIAISIQKGAPNVLSLFKCTSERAKLWHASGQKFVHTGGTPPSMSKVIRDIAKDMPTEMYTSDKLRDMDLSLINSYQNKNAVH